MLIIAAQRGATLSAKFTQGENEVALPKIKLLLAFVFVAADSWRSWGGSTCSDH